VKLSIKAMMIAGALIKAGSFLFTALVNLLWPPYGGAYLAMLTSLFPWYRPETGAPSLILGSLYSLLAGGCAGALFAWVYNLFAEHRSGR
jgi:hypothetical protein